MTIRLYGGPDPSEWGGCLDTVAEMGHDVFLFELMGTSAVSDESRKKRSVSRAT